MSSLGSLFESPGQQASDAAQGAQRIGQQGTAQTEQYVDAQNQQLRQAIAAQAPHNEYFDAAAALKPTPVNPANTAAFGGGGPPGTFAAPAPPPVVAQPQPAPQPIPPGTFARRMPQG